MQDDLLCHRCGAMIRPGDGRHWEVRIEAVADPTPDLSDAADCGPGDLAQAIADAAELSEADAMRGIYRKLVIHLCNRCFAAWIDDPTA